VTLGQYLPTDAPITVNGRQRNNRVAVENGQASPLPQPST